MQDTYNTDREYFFIIARIFAKEKWLTPYFTKKSQPKCPNIRFPGYFIIQERDVNPVYKTSLSAFRFKTDKLT